MAGEQLTLNNAEADERALAVIRQAEETGLKFAVATALQEAYSEGFKKALDEMQRRLEVVR